MLSDATITAISVAFVGAIPPTLVGIALIVQARGNAKKAQDNQAVLVERAAEIHTLTNGSLTKVTTTLDAAQLEIAGLKALVASLIEKKTIDK